MKTILVTGSAGFIGKVEYPMIYCNNQMGEVPDEKDIALVGMIYKP